MMNNSKRTAWFVFCCIFLAAPTLSFAQTKAVSATTPQGRFGRGPTTHLQSFFRPEPTYDAGILKIRSQLQGVAKPHLSAVLRAQVAGAVEELHVTEGQQVREGTPLLTLEGDTARAALAFAKAEAKQTAGVRGAELAVERAADQLMRVKRAYQQEACSQFEVEEKRSVHSLALAARDLQLELQAQSAAKVKMAQAEVDALTLRAPFDGHVVQIHSQLGNSANPNEPAITFSALEKLLVEMYLPLEMFGKVALNSKQELVAADPVSTTISGTVIYVSPVVESTSGTFRCVIEVPNKEQILPAGFQVRLQFSPSVTQNSVTLR